MPSGCLGSQRHFGAATGLAGGPCFGAARRRDDVGKARRRAGSDALAGRCASVPLRCLVAVRPHPTESRGRAGRGHCGCRPKPAGRSSPAADRIKRGPTARPGLDRSPASRHLRTLLPSAPELPAKPLPPPLWKSNGRWERRCTVELDVGEILCRAKERVGGARIKSNVIVRQNTCCGSPRPSASACSVGAGGRGHRRPRAATDRRAQFHRSAHGVNANRQ